MNPVADRTLSKDNRAHNWQVFGNAFAEIDFLPHLTLRSSFGGTLNFDYGYSYGIGTYEPPRRGVNSSFFEFSEYRLSSTWTNTLIYDQKFADGQQLKILLGTEQKDNNGRFVNGSRSGYKLLPARLNIVREGNYRHISIF